MAVIEIPLPDEPEDGIYAQKAYADSANGWCVYIYSDCEWGSSSAYMWLEIEENLYGRTFSIVEKDNTNNRFNSGSYLAVGKEYYLYVYEDGVYSQQAGPFVIDGADFSKYTLTYDVNGGSGVPSPVKNISATTISSIIPTRDGYDFLGWSTSSSATSASYVEGDLIWLSSDTTLYAVWEIKTYTVTYDANGGSNAPSPDKKIYGETLILTSDMPTPPEDISVSYTVTFNANGGTCAQDMTTVTNITTYEFANWDTNLNGDGTTYQPGGSYVYNNDVTLYAQYAPTTTYNSITLPTPSKENYVFWGWGIDEDDTSGITGEYVPTEDITLYAIWKIKGQVYICDSTGVFNPYMIFIYDGSGWDQYIPYIYTESGWEVYSV